jgi:uncharacterized protein (DUF1800 family)
MPDAKITRWLLAAAAVLGAQGATPGGNSPANFEAKLTPDQKIEQALNRMTFGARPGDLDEVRKIGLEKWIELQLHPERIPENKALDGRLEPLETLRLDSAEIYKQYFPRYPAAMLMMDRPMNLNELLGAELMRKVLNGTAEQRLAALKSLDPDKRTLAVSMLPDTVVEDLPELKKERDAARQKRNMDRVAEQRRLHPALRDLLSDDQVAIVTRGTTEERAALLASLDPDKRDKALFAFPPNALAGMPEWRRASAMMRFPQEVVLDDLREAKLFRAILSNRQLQEVLADFWFNHFNVYEGKGQPDRVMLASYERDAIRPHVLGKFKDLLLAVTRHPAMLYYLDNWESMGSDIFDVGPFAPGQFGPVQALSRMAHGLNENFGRELLELHTLGVNGGYTQQDVIAVARCFTGWTIRLPNQKPEFAYASFMHDADEKTVLGRKIAAGGGESDGLQVIDILARHPSTAHFVATKLARRFVADDPPPALVDMLARVFLKTDGDLRAVMEALFTSREFNSQGAWLAKVKSPLEMVASAARAVDADVADTYTLAQNVTEMGEPLYQKESPNGFKDSADTWLSTASVTARIRFAEALAEGKIPGVKVDFSHYAAKDRVEIARAILGREPAASTWNAMISGPAGDNMTAVETATLMLSSPDFQRR